MALHKLSALALLALMVAVGRAQQAVYPVPFEIPDEVRAMIELIRSTDPTSRSNGLNILILMKERAAPAAPYIAELLGDGAHPRPEILGSWRTRPIGSTAAFALAAIGKPAVAAAAAVLKSGKPAARLGALNALARIDDESVAAPLAAALRDDDPRVQQAARFAAFGYGRKKARLPIQPVLDTFTNGNPFARQASLEIIGGIQYDRDPDKGAVEAVFRGLNDADPDVRGTALRVLSASGKWIHEDRAIEPLLRALRHGDDGVRTNAASSLGQYKDTRAVPLLIAQLKDQDGNNARACAAYALGQIGDASAIEALCARLKDEPVDYVRDASAIALGDIGSPKALEALFQTIRNPDRSVRHPNVTAIEKISGRHFDQHPLWQKLLDDEKRGGDRR